MQMCAFNGCGTLWKVTLFLDTGDYFVTYMKSLFMPLHVSTTFYVCRCTQECEAITREYEVKFAVERAKLKKLGLMRANFQEDLLLVVSTLILQT